MNDLINEMNRILHQWQSKYDILHCTQLHFTLGEGDALYLNDIPVPGFLSLPLESVTFDIEHILYHFAHSHTLHATISWPEEGIPSVSSVSYHKSASLRPPA